MNSMENVVQVPDQSRVGKPVFRVKDKSVKKVLSECPKQKSTYEGKS